MKKSVILDTLEVILLLNTFRTYCVCPEARSLVLPVEKVYSILELQCPFGGTVRWIHNNESDIECPLLVCIYFPCQEQQLLLWSAYSPRRPSVLCFFLCTHNSIYSLGPNDHICGLFGLLNSECCPKYVQNITWQSLMLRYWLTLPQSERIHTQICISSAIGTVKMPHLSALINQNDDLCVVSQSARETKAAAHVLQTIWTYKDLRNTLNKAGWTKSHFKVPVALFSSEAQGQYA